MNRWTPSSRSYRRHARWDDKTLTVHWRVLEATYADAGEPSTRHFVGADAIDKTGRVGSAIQSIDLASRKGVTRSGRVYELVGAPGWDAEGEYVWGIWCGISEVVSCTDVTAEVIASMVEDAAEVSGVKPRVKCSERGESK